MDNYTEEETKAIIEFLDWFGFCLKSKLKIKKELDGFDELAVIHDMFCPGFGCEKARRKQLLENLLKRKISSESQFKTDMGYVMATMSAQSLDEKIQKEVEDN